MATRSRNLESFFDARVGERTRELLENFDVVETLQHLVLVPRGKYLKDLRENVRAAVVASTLHLESLDYAKRRYCETEDDDSESDPTVDAYIAAYDTAKIYITQSLGKLQTEGHPDPTVGVFGASLALQRLPPSFFCAHLLYRMGHGYEGHAVSRLILEQIAWAYAAHGLDDIDAIAKIETTRAISHLKRLAPDAGQIYGFLSNKTHIDYSSHGEFLRVEDGKNFVLHAQPRYVEYGHAIVLLADLFGLVWELSQLAYVKTPEAIVVGKNGPMPNPKRPFIEKMHECIGAIERTLRKVDDKAGQAQTNTPLKSTRRKPRAP